MEEYSKKLQAFINRLGKLGIKVTLGANFPWIYLDTVNGIRVTEKFNSKYGFTIAFTPLRRGQPFFFTETKVIFELIRRYSGFNTRKTSTR